MSVGTPSRTIRPSRPMSRSTASGGRIGKATSGVPLPAVSMAMVASAPSALGRRVRRLIQFFTNRRIFAPSTGKLDVVLRLVPGPTEFGLEMRTVRSHDDRVGRPQAAERRPIESVIDLLARRPAVHGKHDCNRGRSRRTLGKKIEVPELGDLVSNELETNRFSHTEAVDVEDPAAHTVLGDLLHHRCPFEPDAVEVACQVFRAPHVSLMQLEPRALHRSRDTGPLEKGAGGRQHDADAPRPTRSSVSTRSPATSACGSASPNPSRGGYNATAVSATSDCRSASSRSASGSPCVTTARNRPGSRRASAATITAADDPGSPTTVRRSPGAGIVLSSRVNAGSRSIASSKRGSATRASGCYGAGQAARRSADAAARPGPRCRRVTRLSASTSIRAAARNSPPSGRPALASYTAATQRVGLASTVTPRPRKRAVNDLSGNRARSDSRGSGLTTSAPTRAPPRRRK